MHPLSHAILTLLFSLPIALKLNDPAILVFAVLLTVFIDVIDHALYLIFFKNDFANNAKVYIKRYEFISAWNYYYSNRKKYIDFLVIHNIISFSLLSMFILFFYNINIRLFYILALGIIFHFICDLVEDIIFKKNERFWYNGWRIFLNNVFHLEL